MLEILGGRACKSRIKVRYNECMILIVLLPTMRAFDFHVNHVLEPLDDGDVGLSFTKGAIASNLDLSCSGEERYHFQT